MKFAFLFYIQFILKILNAIIILSHVAKEDSFGVNDSTNKPLYSLLSFLL